MRALTDAWRRLRSLAGRREIEDRLDDEIRFHVEQQIEKNQRAGMTPDDARRQALIRFGGVEQTRERTRDEFRAAPIENLARDVRYGLRSLLRNPGFSAMAVLSLAIGIGANAPPVTASPMTVAVVPPRSICATANVDATIPLKASVVPLRRSSMFGCDSGPNARPASVS